MSQTDSENKVEDYGPSEQDYDYAKDEIAEVEKIKEAMSYIFGAMASTALADCSHDNRQEAKEGLEQVIDEAFFEGLKRAEGIVERYEGE